MIKLPLILCLPFILCCSRINDSGNSEQKAPIRYLALGDSYTIGEKVEPDERWPVQLADTLTIKGIPVDTVEIIARTGWTTAELLQGIDANRPTGTFDLVSLLIGVNNQFRGLPIETFQAEFQLLLDRAVAFAGNDSSRVFVLSIPDYGVTPFAQGPSQERISSEIDQYNSLKQEMTQARGITWFNITDISRLAADDTSLLASDGLHPSGKMYSMWVSRIADSVAALIGKETP